MSRPEEQDPVRLVRGVSPVLEVPFTATGEVDLEGFRRVVQYVRSCGVSSMMFPGFASEYHKLAEEERSALTEILLEQTRDDPQVASIVAVQDHATALAVRRARSVVSAGADLVNLLPPHFLSPSRRSVVEHVEAVLSSIAPAPLVLQYAPAETGTSLDVGVLDELAAAHPNLRLVKAESSPPGPLIAQLAAAPARLPAVEGHAGVHLPDSVRRGAVGSQPGCSVTEIYVRIWDELTDGDAERGQELHRRLLPYIGNWMLGIERIVAFEKQVSASRGLFESAYCREPTYHLDGVDHEMVEALLAEFADLLPTLG